MRSVLPCDPPWTGFQSSPGVVQATGACMAHSRAEGGQELVPGNTGLFQHAVQGAVLQFLVVWNDTPGRPASQDDVAPALTSHDKTELFEGVDGLTPRNAREARHSQRPRKS